MKNFGRAPFVLLFFLLLCLSARGQQDPQFTQYMFNTLSINPGYAGARETLSATALHRTQWIGVEGAPQTQTLAIHGPLYNEQLGLGLTVVNDMIGPSNETWADVNFSYTIYTGIGQVAFGLKAGARLLNVDFGKGLIRTPDASFQKNVANQFSPTIGAGVYFHSDKYYFGLSSPNFLTTKHYDDFQETMAKERLHYYAIGGMVFDLKRGVKFKPAFLAKGVTGAPISVDLSLNFLLEEKVMLGASYRWDDSVSFLAGLQLGDNWFAALSYDYKLDDFGSFYNQGSFDVTLRFEILKRSRIRAPRFF